MSHAYEVRVSRDELGGEYIGGALTMVEADTLEDALASAEAYDGRGYVVRVADDATYYDGRWITSGGGLV